MSVDEGGSAGEKARALRHTAAEYRLKAERIDVMASKYESGEVGERRVADVLRPLEGAHCHVLYDRLLNPGQSRVNLDHIVVSVAGAYLIDAKNWSGQVTASPAGLNKTVNGRTRSMNQQADKVRHMAEKMELATSTVIEPVICLAGDQAATFGEPIQVRGVFVVPVDRLADWLTSRPRPTGTNDLRRQTVKFAATFPSATQPAFLAIPPRRPHRRATSPDRRATITRTGGRRKQRPPVRPAGSRRARMLKRLLALAALLLMMPLVITFVIVGSTVAGKALAHHIAAGLPTPTTTNWTPPCTGVTDGIVAKADAHTVYRYQNGSGDTCTWGYVPRPGSLAPGNIKIATGWTAKYGYSGIGPTAKYLHTATSETLVVPQFAAVPGSNVPAARITQPIAVTVSWSGTQREPAHVKQAVTTLAGETAKHMPTGPGSSTITYR
jgi:hypothetical protein